MNVNRSHQATPPEQAMGSHIASAFPCRTRPSSRAAAVNADQTEPSTAPPRGPLNDARCTSRHSQCSAILRLSACWPVGLFELEGAVGLSWVGEVGTCQQIAIDIALLAFTREACCQTLLLLVSVRLPAFISLLRWILLDYRFPSYSFHS